MENTELHAQKVTILSRLVKDNAITLEEALLLLKDEDVPAFNINHGSTSIGTITYPSHTWQTYSSGQPIIGTTTTITNSAVPTADINN